MKKIFKTPEIVILCFDTEGILTESSSHARTVAEQRLNEIKSSQGIEQQGSYILY